MVAAAAEAAWVGQEAEVAVVTRHHCSEAPTCQAPHNVQQRARCWKKRGTASINSGGRAAARRIRRSRRGASNKRSSRNVLESGGASRNEGKTETKVEEGKEKKERERERERE